MKQCPRCGKKYDESWMVCLTCRDTLVSDECISAKIKDIKPLEKNTGGIYAATILLSIFGFVGILAAISTLPVLFSGRIRPGYYHNVFIYLGFSSSVGIGSIISSIGLFKRKKWGRLVAIIISLLWSIGWGAWATRFFLKHGLSRLTIIEFLFAFSLAYVAYYLTRPKVREQFK